MGLKPHAPSLWKIGFLAPFDFAQGRLKVVPFQSDQRQMQVLRLRGVRGIGAHEAIEVIVEDVCVETAQQEP